MMCPYGYLSISLTSEHYVLLSEIFPIVYKIKLRLTVLALSRITYQALTVHFPSKL